MATTNDSLSPLAERLLSRSGKGPRIGAGARLFERLGMANPYEGGAVSDPSQGEQRFSFLSSEGYFAELRGLTRFRSQLLQRIGRVRAGIRAHQRFDRHVATAAVRALNFGQPDALERTFVDWSSQADVPEADLDAPVSRERPERRQTAAERALHREIGSASKVLEQLERLASMSHDDSTRRLRKDLAGLSTLPPEAQADAVHRAARQLRGVAAVAARGTDLHRAHGGSERNGQRQLATAQRRQDPAEPRGLQRVLDSSPVMMELENPASVESMIPQASSRRPSMARPAVREHAHRSQPVARAAVEARDQASVGRAGPPAVTSVPQRAAHRSIRSNLRPTARIAKVAQEATNAPLYNTSRGLDALRPASASTSAAARLGRRQEAGLLSASGQVAAGLGYARPLISNRSAAGSVRITADSNTPAAGNVRVGSFAPLAEDAFNVVGPADSAVVEELPALARAVERTRSERKSNHAGIAPVVAVPRAGRVAREAAALAGPSTTSVGRVRRDGTSAAPGMASRLVDTMASSPVTPDTLRAMGQDVLTERLQGRLAQSETSGLVDQVEGRSALTGAPRDADSDALSGRSTTRAASEPTALAGDRPSIAGERSSNAGDRASVAAGRTAEDLLSTSANRPSSVTGRMANADAGAETTRQLGASALEAAAARGDASFAGRPDSESANTSASVSRIADGTPAVRGQAAASGLSDDAMRFGTFDPEAPSALRSVLGAGSRRNQARPTVRAAARALAQERSGARGRMLAPSVSSHVDVVNATDAMRADTQVVAPFNRSMAPNLLDRERRAVGSTMGDQAVAARLVGRLDGDAAGASVVAADSERQVRPDTVLADDVMVHASSVEPVVEDATGVAAPARLGNTSRAVARSMTRQRAGESGDLLSPRVVAPFEQESRTLDTLLARSASHSPRVAPFEPEARTIDTLVARSASPAVDSPDAMPTSLVAGRLASRSGENTDRRTAVTRDSDGQAPPARQLASPTELTLARAVSDEAAVEPSGMAVRASRRGRVAPETARRTVTQAVTPEQQTVAARRTLADVLKRSEEAPIAAVAARADASVDEKGRASTKAPMTSALEGHRTPAGTLVDARTVRTESSEVERSIAHRTRTAAAERSAAVRTPRGFADPAKVFRTPSSANPRAVGWRTQAGELQGAASGTTGVRTHTPAMVAAARQQDPAQYTSRQAPFADAPMLDALYEPTVETPAVETGLGRAMRRFDASRSSLTESPVMGAPELVLPIPHLSVQEAGVSEVQARAERREARVSGDASTPRTPATVGGVDTAPAFAQRAPSTSHALARSLKHRRSESMLERPVPSARMAEASTTLVNGPGSIEGVLLSGGEAVDHGSIAGGQRPARREPAVASRSRMQEALKAVASVRASKRTNEAVVTLPSVQRAQQGKSPSMERLQARVETDADGNVLRTVITDSVTGERVVRPMRQVEQRMEDAAEPAPQADVSRTQRLADDRFVPLSADGVAPGRTTVGPERAFAGTLDALVTPNTDATGGNKPLLRRRAWNRRSMAVELGVQTPTLAGADFVPEDQRLDAAPAWARRAGKGTSSLSPEALRQTRPERESNGLMSALARAERPDEIVKVIIDRRSEIRGVRGEVPVEAVRLMERIGSFTGPEAEALRNGSRVMAAPEQSMLGTSRSHKGSGDLTQLSAGTNGLGATRVMKLADKLMGLIHLAENSRQKDAQDQVRMAQDSLEARAEGGAKFPGLSVEDHDMNIEQLQKSVLDSVMEHFEELDSRREEPDGRNKWW